MIIAMDVTAIGSGLGGDETLVTGMLRGLVAMMPPGDRLLVLAAQDAQLPPEALADGRVEIDRVVRRGGPVHFAVTLPRWLRRVGRRCRPDVVVSNTHAPLFSSVPSVLVVPDLSFLHVADCYPRMTALRLKVLVRQQVRRARAVLTISEFCRRDLIDSYGLDPADVHVIPLVPAPVAEPSAAARARLAARGVTMPYVTYLGNLHPRKNVARTIRAFLTVRQRETTLAGTTFVIAGGRWFSGSAEELAAAAGPPGSVVFLGRVDDEEREVLLRDARALLYLSTFEGFGLPPLEAMARGTPVVASDKTSIPEVCGDGALLVDPLDDERIVEAISAILTDEELRVRLRGAGKVRAADFTVRRTGKALLAALVAAQPIRMEPEPHEEVDLQRAGQHSGCGGRVGRRAADRDQGRRKSRRPG